MIDSPPFGSGKMRGEGQTDGVESQQARENQVLFKVINIDRLNNQITP
jgi:hypothetical protein